MDVILEGLGEIWSPNGRSFGASGAIWRIQNQRSVGSKCYLPSKVDGTPKTTISPVPNHAKLVFCRDRMLCFLSSVCIASILSAQNAQDLHISSHRLCHALLPSPLFAMLCKIMTSVKQCNQPGSQLERDWLLSWILNVSAAGG